MTEYDYSPEAYLHYLTTQERIARRTIDTPSWSVSVPLDRESELPRSSDKDRDRRRERRSSTPPPPSSSRPVVPLAPPPQRAQRTPKSYPYTPQPQPEHRRTRSSSQLSSAQPGELFPPRQTPAPLRQRIFGLQHAQPTRTQSSTATKSFTAVLPLSSNATELEFIQYIKRAQTKLEASSDDIHQRREFVKFQESSAAVPTDTTPPAPPALPESILPTEALLPDLYKSLPPFPETTLQIEDSIRTLLRSWSRRGHLVSTTSQPSRGSRKSLEVLEGELTTCLVRILDSPPEMHTVRQLPPSSGQSLLDAVHHVLDRGSLENAQYRSKARRLMQKLSETLEQLPGSLFIAGINDYDAVPTFHGGFGDVYRASHQGRMVAVKRIRSFMSNAHRARLQFLREALVWQGLDHRFILPLIGIDRDTFADSFCMVSPWMKEGTVLKYLETHGRADVDRLLREIAQGLRYLHSKHIVHGDLRGANILISDAGHGCLADFGLATTISEDITELLTSSSNRAGSVRWFAPELILPADFGCAKFARTPASDVYAYACVCVELYTGRPPFADVTPETAAMFRVIRGERPRQPASMSEPLWRLVSAGWAPTPGTRPTVGDILALFPSHG